MPINDASDTPIWRQRMLLAACVGAVLAYHAASWFWGAPMWLAGINFFVVLPILVFGCMWAEAQPRAWLGEWSGWFLAAVFLAGLVVNTVSAGFLGRH